MLTPFFELRGEFGRARRAHDDNDRRRSGLIGRRHDQAQNRNE
jgi:hypothetical protein